MRARLVTSTLLSVLTVSVSPSWEIQTSGVEARLRGLSVVNEQVAWASGTGGTVVRTTDGGRHWSTVRVPDAENLDFRDIDAFDETTASVMSIGNGRDSRIYRTLDGGATWTVQFINEDPKVFLDAMAFWSPQRGVAFSDSVDGQLVILTTTDGWKWTRVPTAGLPPALPEEGAYAASGTNVAVYGQQHVWIATSRSRVLRSTDGGRTWTVAATPIPTGSASGIFSVAFRDERHGVVVGGDYQKPGEAIDNVAMTTDGGVTWTLAKGLTGYRSVVTHRPRTTTWYAAGPSGMDVSTDDGKTWTAFSDHGFHTFAFVPASRYGWGAGERGKIARLVP